MHDKPIARRSRLPAQQEQTELDRAAMTDCILLYLHDGLAPYWQKIAQSGMPGPQRQARLNAIIADTLDYARQRLRQFAEEIATAK